jgi:sterol desaturase/sphingolipid hydroxylase (fatty acid hydroxylase superfamily)
MESAIRLGVFLALLAALALAERRRPRRPLSQSRRRRWAANLGLVGIDTALARLTLGAAAVLAAEEARARGLGLLNATEWPAWAEAALAFAALDMAVYWQHVWTHRIPALWRLHRVHHADLDLDVTSGLRFHPVEILVSLAYKAAAAAALGAPPAVVVAFEIALNAGSLFSHANLRLPARLDRALRLVLVTPDMHRVHHSTVRRETDSNYGFFLSVWDRLFGTYRPEPAAGQLGMAIGLEEWRDQGRLGLGALLAMPFREPERSGGSPGASPAPGETRPGGT